jgi:hypothetical protein
VKISGKGVVDGDCRGGDGRVAGIVKISGVVDGDGSVWWDKYWRMRREEHEPNGLGRAVHDDCRRPSLIRIYDSSDVDLEGLTPGRWCTAATPSNVTVDGLTIRDNIRGAPRGPAASTRAADSRSPGP